MIWKPIIDFDTGKDYVFCPDENMDAWGELDVNCNEWGGYAFIGLAAARFDSLKKKRRKSNSNKVGRTKSLVFFLPPAESHSILKGNHSFDPFTCQKCSVMVSATRRSAPRIAPPIGSSQRDTIGANSTALVRPHVAIPNPFQSVLAHLLSFHREPTR